MATLSSVLAWRVPQTEVSQTAVHGVARSRTQLSDQGPISRAFMRLGISFVLLQLLCSYCMIGTDPADCKHYNPNRSYQFLSTHCVPCTVLSTSHASVMSSYLLKNPHRVRTDNISTLYVKEWLSRKLQRDIEIKQIGNCNGSPQTRMQIFTVLSNQAHNSNPSDFSNP